jgi:hypothetical protein
MFMAVVQTAGDARGAGVSDGAGPGLSIQDVESIRAQLASGRRPRVVFTAAAGQIAGQTGQVVQLTDPGGDDEFIVVRFGHDELPFSPADVMIPPRGMAARRAEPKPAAEVGPPVVSGPPLASDLFGAATTVAQPTAPTPHKEPSMSVSTVDSSVPSAADDGGVSSKPRKAAKQARPKAPAALIVTLSYSDGEWTVAANQGTRALAKPYLVKASEALKMVALLDVPGVQEAVEQIVSVERSEAEQHAQQLRAQLAEVEAKLAELTDLH